MSGKKKYSQMGIKLDIKPIHPTLRRALYQKHDCESRISPKCTGTTKSVRNLCVQCVREIGWRRAVKRREEAKQNEKETK